MSCTAHCCAIQQQFDNDTARKDVDRYRRRGPDASTRTIVEFVRGSGVTDASLLDIGGGVGVLQLELLGNSARAATLVEASAAYLGVARTECQRLEASERVDFLQADFIDVADQLHSADIVTLDRVICCYPDATRLVRASCAKARQLYAFSVPRSRWYMRIVDKIGNIMRRLAGNSFRTYVHDIGAIESLLTSVGFERAMEGGSFVWHVALWRRSRPST